MKRILYCTYCSAGKRKDPGKLPAIRRYSSARIRGIYRRSCRDVASFAILSGEFGLLGPFQGIPYYDHLLQAGEVDGLLPQMAGYLERKGFRAVRFFHEQLRRNPQLAPYCGAIRKACRKAGVRLEMVEIPSKFLA